MSLQRTSDAVNEVVEAVRAQVARLRALVAPSPDEVNQLLALGTFLAQVENNRGQMLVGIIAGRRNLDKLPPADLEQVVKAIAGIEDEGQRR